MPSVWDHDLWADIYDVPDPITKNTIAQLYRLILDMRESDVLAQKVAAAINKERRLALTFVQKTVGLAFGVLLAVDTGVHLYQALGG